MKPRSAPYAQRTTPDASNWSAGRQALDTIRNEGRFGQVPRRKAALICLALLAFSAGCGTACKCCRPASVAPASAPERVEIDGREYTLAASAWRDFQPVAPSDGQPLAVVVKVSSADGMSLPAGLSMDRVWVLDGKKEWSAAPEPATREPAATRLESVVRGGPKWDPGINVDVVARLKQGKQTWLVRQAGVTIKRTD